MKAKNHYYNYLGNEDKMQNELMNYIDLKYPNAIVTHIPNEGKRTPFEQYKIKMLGTKPGVPDVMIFTPSAQYNGFALELKSGYNKPTENQKKWLSKLKDCGWYATWSKDLEDCKTKIDNYFSDALE